MVSIWMSVWLSVCRTSVRSSVFSFLDDNLSKYIWIFTKLDTCINIVEIWFGIANGRILSISFICPKHGNDGKLSFHVFIYHYFSIRSRVIKLQ